MENQELIIKAAMVTVFLVLVSFGIQILISHIEAPVICGTQDIVSCARSQ